MVIPYAAIIKEIMHITTMLKENKCMIRLFCAILTITAPPPISLAICATLAIAINLVQIPLNAAPFNCDKRIMVAKLNTAMARRVRIFKTTCLFNYLLFKKTHVKTVKASTRQYCFLLYKFKFRVVL